MECTFMDNLKFKPTFYELSKVQVSLSFGGCFGQDLTSFYRTLMREEPNITLTCVDYGAPKLAYSSQVYCIL